MARKKTAPDISQAMAQLETLVQQLESGELSLEASLSTFEQGIKLARDCQQALADAEQRVKLLLAEAPDGRAKTVDFETGEEEEDDGDELF